MQKLIAAMMIAFALSSPAMAFDLGGINGIPSDIKDTIAMQSGGRITNKQGSQQAGQQQLAGQDDQQQGGQRARYARKGQKGSMQAQAMQSVQSMMNGDSDIGSSVGSFMGR